MSYARQIAMAKRLIAKKGTLVTWIKQAGTTSNTQPWKVTAANPVTYPVSVVYTSHGKQPFRYLTPGSEVPDGETGALMAQVPFTPEMGDTILDGTEKFVIKSIDVVQPASEVILYKLSFV